MHDAVANGKAQRLLHIPQLLTSFRKSKPSSTTPLQLLSNPSHASTPAFDFVHSQPLVGSLSASKKSVKQLNLHSPATQAGVEFLTRQEWKHLPQFETSVCRSGAVSLQVATLPPAPPPPLPPRPAPPLPPPPDPAAPPKPPSPIGLL